MIFPASHIGLSAILLLGAGPARALGPACAADNGGWTLPKGFCAVVVADSLGPVRHIAVAPNGDVLAAVSGPNGGIRVLRDTNGDGKADLVAWFYQGIGGTGLALSGDAVYFAPNDRVLRFPWKPGALAPSGPPEIIVSGLPIGGHQAKGIVLGNGGDLFVSFGSATNSCQGDNDRKGAYPGIFPCPELPLRAGVWRFDLRRRNQTAADGTRWATGLRNPMALSLEPSAGIVYAAVHGRDQLAENWKWSVEAGRENPAETVFALTKGTDGGWPYCYVDSRQPLQLQNPEYGGDGAKIGNCDTKAMPALTFPGHWAPNATVFYTGTQFPPTYRGGLFIAFHGSWNRSPAPQEGYRVVFAPFAKGRAFGTSETFAAPSGLATSLRPSGLAVGPDGSLYIGADANAKIWRVIYIGN
jgi:glucose/arabinose dehydrogenase